jgi:hypothetical protein
MKVRLFLAERANIPTYGGPEHRAIDGEWEPGWDYIQVPLGPMPMHGHHGDIEAPINVPTSSCAWWAPLRVATEKPRGKR